MAQRMNNVKAISQEEQVLSSPPPPQSSRLRLEFLGFISPIAGSSGSGEYPRYVSSYHIAGNTAQEASRTPSPPGVPFCTVILSKG